jgi:hypothetical protein
MCARPGCEETFVKKTHNQKYHDNDCCRLATNSRIMEDYYEGRDRKAGKARYCRVCESTKLSRYNTSRVCASCASRQVVETNNSVKQMLANVSLSS